MRMMGVVLLAALVPATAYADFWSDDTGRFNERLSSFNHTFELTTKGAIDGACVDYAGLGADAGYFTDCSQWPSDLCGASVIETIAQNFYTTHYGKPSAVRLGLKKIKTIRCAYGAEKNLTVSGDTLTIVLDKTSGQNDPPMVSEAMLRLFPALAWDGAEEGIEGTISRVNRNCGIAAKLSYDRAHINAVSYAEHVMSVAGACGDVVGLLANGCQYNSKVKAAVQKVTSFVCTAGPDRAVRIEPTRVTVTVTGYQPNQYALDDTAMQTMLEKALPGSNKSWKW